MRLINCVYKGRLNARSKNFSISTKVKYPHPNFTSARQGNNLVFLQCARIHIKIGICECMYEMSQLWIWKHTDCIYNKKCIYIYFWWAGKALNKREDLKLNIRAVIYLMRRQFEAATDFFINKLACWKSMRILPKFE